MNKILGFSCDLDGTLVDSIGMWNDVDQILIETVSGQKIDSNIVRSDRDDFLAKHVTGDIYLQYANFLKITYGSNYSTDDINNLRNTICKQYLEKSIDYKPDADKFLSLVLSKNYPICLATIGSDWVIDIYKEKNKNIRSKMPFDKAFGTNILTKDDVHSKKPDPEVYYKASEKLGIPVANMCVLEDSLSGIQSAKSAGIGTIISIYDKYSDNDREEINRLSDYSVENYTELLNLFTKTLCPDTYNDLSLK